MIASERLGHSKVGITRDLYSRVQQDTVAGGVLCTLSAWVIWLKAKSKA